MAAAGLAKLGPLALVPLLAVAAHRLATMAGFLLTLAAAAVDAGADSATACACSGTARSTTS